MLTAPCWADAPPPHARIRSRLPAASVVDHSPNLVLDQQALDFMSLVTPSVNEVPELVAIFSLAPATDARMAISDEDTLDALRRFIRIVVQIVESSGGVCRPMGADTMHCFWALGNEQRVKKTVGTAILTTLAAIDSLRLRGGRSLMPIVGVATGPVLHAQLHTGARLVGMGPAVNLARELIQLYVFLKRKVLFPRSLADIWPAEIAIELVAVPKWHRSSTSEELCSLVLE